MGSLPLPETSCAHAESGIKRYCLREVMRKENKDSVTHANISFALLYNFSAHYIQKVYQIFTMSAASYGNDVWDTLVDNRNNLTALKTIEAPHWVSAAEFRGTMAILQSCILTIVACVYTALHMNVLETSSSAWTQLLHKAKWVIVALLAPELVLASAAGQLLQALQFRNSMRMLQAESMDNQVKTVSSDRRRCVSSYVNIFVGGKYGCKG